jgi:hypothetical protein
MRNRKQPSNEDCPQHRWATRREAMAYARMGSTKMNDLLQGRAILAKKHGRKVIVDLNSIDAFYAALPDVGSQTTVTA